MSETEEHPLNTCQHIEWACDCTSKCIHTCEECLEKHLAEKQFGLLEGCKDALSALEDTMVYNRQVTPEFAIKTLRAVLKKAGH